MDPAKEKEVEDEYLSSLMDLNVNSKPLINMLTMLAEDNLECGPIIVRAIEKHLAQVSPDVKLPILYLIDSIVKNVGDRYKQLFAQNIVNIFCGVFEKVNEKVREKMFNLRQTWNDVFPQTKLYALDVKVNVMDSNWPITAKVVPKSVHVNPNFLKSSENQAKEDLLKQMQAKERELLELRQRKIELELLVTKKKIAEQEKEIQKGVSPIGIVPASAVVVPPTASSGMPSMPAMNPGGRIRIAPVSSAMISSARSRDPRLLKTRSQAENTAMNQQISTASVLPLDIMGNVSTKSLPRIPKYSNSGANNANKAIRDHDERDPRKRREKEREESKSKGDPRDKSRSSKSSSDRKKSSSSSSESPRKRSDEEKKSSKSSSSSHHKSSHSSRSHSSKSSSKNSTINNINSSDKPKEDVDLRILPTMDSDMRQDSTTMNDKLNKNKLLNELLHDEDMKTSQDMMISTSNNEESETEQKLCDTDLRFVEPGKKRSMSSEPLEMEPTNKKNKTETDTLFGSEDVDLRALNEPPPEKKSKLKEKSDFEAVRAKLNASKSKMKTGGVKLLDEIQPMPITENGTSDLVRKILQKKKTDTKEPSPVSINEINERAVKKEPSPPIIPPNIMTQPPPKIEEERKEEIVDYGSMTAAELRKTTSVPASIRKDKRKESKWSQPTMPPTMPWMNVNRMTNAPNMIPLPQHFINPWETNPMVVAMQKQSQLPLVVPQSPSQPILNNKMRTLRLDGTRDHLLRFYGEVAIIFNEAGEAHDIRFSSGQSKVIIDDVYGDVLSFNNSYKPIVIDGVIHQIKFGTPTRELYIDDHFYECYFNNQITQIILGDKVRRIRIEGKAPEVKIGVKRNDIVLGLINMMIDAEIMVPVFLDTTLQYFEYKGQIFTLQFADFFLSVIINNEPFKVEFGGLPKNYILNGQKHFIRFTVLPDEIVPGKINMRGMRRTHLFRNCKSPPLIDAVTPMPEKPIENMNMDISQLVENDMRVQPPQLPINTNTMPPNMIPGISEPPPSVPNVSLPDLNISELLQKLVATGIIGNNASTTNTSSPPPNIESNKNDNLTNSQKDDARIQKQVLQKEEAKIVPVNLTRPETIKKRQQAIIDTLYSGLQCSSCGLRFPPEQTIKYSQHLDWHFRQNRRERDSKRKAHSRKWYYNQSDWIKYEEIEDLDEREKNFFETQQMEAMDQCEDSNGHIRLMGNQENATISCPAGPEDVNRSCDMCHDQFEQFFNEETEEWHLRSAIKVEDKFFHPICYEDYKSSLTFDESGLNDAVNDVNNQDEDMEDSVVLVKEEKIEEGENNQQKPEVNGDDDDVIVLPQEEPIITEIPDEPDTEQAVEKEDNQTLNATDDDVMIQEPKIETQIVNDDDEDNLGNSEETTQPLIVKIKEEPKDDGYEDAINDEDQFVEVTSINEELMLEDGHETQHSPFQPALLDENAIFDESSLMMQSQASPQNDDFLDDDNSSRPDANGTIIGGNKKLKIVLSSLVQNNLTNKNLSSSNNVNIEQNDNNSNIDSVNKLVDSNSIDLQKDGDHRASDENNQDDTELSYTVKPHLQGFKFERNPLPVKRGIETSGLCSIM